MWPQSNISSGNSIYNSLTFDTLPNSNDDKNNFTSCINQIFAELVFSQKSLSNFSKELYHWFSFF